MLSRIRSLRPLLLIAVVLVIACGATTAFGASDVTTPRAIPYVTSNVATGFNQPTAIAIDDNGNIYVGENYTGATAGSVSALVKKIDATTGAVTVFAGGAASKATTGNSPCGSSAITTVSGGGDIVGDGCPATSTWLGGSNGGIRGLAVYNGYLYIEDLGGYFIHRVNLANNVMELVGGGPTATVWPGDGGPAVVGSDVTKNFNLFKPPTGFAVDPQNGNVYFGAGGTSAPTIRMITSDAATCQNAVGGPYTPPCVITVVNYLVKQTGATIPPAGCQDPAATPLAKSATVSYPQGLAFDGDGNLYVAENKCGAIRKIIKNPATGIVDQNSTFTTLLGNNATSGGTSPSWYDTTGAPSYIGPVRGLLSAGGSGDMYISTGSSVYLYDSTTKWAHRIFGDATPLGCTTNPATPFIGCPAPWATRTDGSGTGAMAVDKAGNLYITDYSAGTVIKVALGTDFIGIAPPVTVSLPTTQYVLLHGGGTTGATADNPFSAALTADTVPKPGCTNYVSTGDNGTDCVMAVTYTPTAPETETGKQLHVLGTYTKDIPLFGMGIPTVNPLVSLTADKSVCAVGGACDLALTATVTPGDVPPSTGLSVSGDMSACTGGSATQAFTGSGNTFTYTCSLPTTAATEVILGVTVKDAQKRSANGTLQVGIIDTPVANPQSVTVTYNTPTPVTLSGTGTGTLTYAVVDQPTHGTLSGTAPAVTYTPTSNYEGADSFTFKASNGVDSLPATVTINVLPAAPVAADQSVTAQFMATTPITLTSTGTGTLTYEIVRPPAHGNLTGTAPDVSYTPDTNYSGPDSFTFKTTDSNNQVSAPATVSITVLSVVPIANDQAVVVTSNTPKAITLTATGMGTLAYTVLTPPSHGTLSGTAPALLYTPESNYLGADSFTFKASNGTDSDPATVSIMVLPAPPVANAQSVTVSYGGSTPITLTATGTGTLTYAVVSQPAHGTLSGTAPNLTYTAGAGYSGADSFTFKATDTDKQDSVAATISIAVLPAVPVATPQSITVTYGGSTPVTLAATGTGTLTYAVVNQPSHGTLSGTAPDLTYTAASGYNGSDSFTFKATDTNNQASAAATVSITVLPAVPVATAQTVTVSYNTAKPITLAATGTGTLTYTVVSGPSHGTLSGTAPALTYTPASNYSGADSFTFKATDSNGQNSTPATVSINVVIPVPVANAQSVTVTYNTAKPIVLTATGIGTLTYTVVAQPAHGTLTGTAPNLTYTPTSNYSGSDSFTFKASDGTQDSATATVSITVSAADLTIVAASGGTTNASVKAGNLAVFNLQVSGWVGSTGSVSFTCSGAPDGANCGISPGTATLRGTAPIAVAVSVQTTGAPVAAAGSLMPVGPGNGFPLGMALTLTALLAIVLASLNGKMQWRAAGACAALVMVVALSGCGNGNASLGSKSTSTQTPAGTYTLTLTATSGDVTKTMPLTLNVQ